MPYEFGLPCPVRPDCKGKHGVRAYRRANPKNVSPLRTSTSRLDDFTGGLGTAEREDDRAETRASVARSVGAPPHPG